MYFLKTFFFTVEHPENNRFLSLGYELNAPEYSYDVTLLSNITKKGLYNIFNEN